VARGALAHSIRIPLGDLQGRLKELDGSGLVVVHCAGGYRSTVAVSLLQRAGFHNVANVIGGFDAWKAAQLPYEIPEVLAV
jgi:rhodanese-related sulfurtransferase